VPPPKSFDILSSHKTHKPAGKNEARSLSRPKAGNTTVVIAEAPRTLPITATNTSVVVPQRDLSLPKAEKGRSLNMSNLVLSPIKTEPPTTMVNNFMPLRSKATTTVAVAPPERRYEEAASSRRFEEPPSSRLYEPYSRPPHRYEPHPSYVQAYPAYERPLAYGERP